MGVKAACAVACVSEDVLECTCSSKFVTFGFSLFQRLERCVGIVTSLTNGLSEREANDALNAHVSVISFRDEKSCLDEIIRGILYLHGSLSEGAGMQGTKNRQIQRGWGMEPAVLSWLSACQGFPELLQLKDKTASWF